MTRLWFASILIILALNNLSEAVVIFGEANVTLPVDSWTTSALTIPESGSLSSIRIGIRIQKQLTSSLYVYLVPPGSTWWGNLSTWDTGDRFLNADVTSGNIFLVGGVGSENDFGIWEPNNTAFNSSSYVRFSTSLDSLYPAKGPVPAPPFGSGLTGLFTPTDNNNEGKLWNLYGMNPTGVWTLVIGVDGSVNNQEGRLIDWFIDTNVCGDGILTAPEQCDSEGDCTPTCQCPLGTAANGQGGCTPPVCGDGRVAYPNETCDGGLGCLATCLCAAGFVPTNPPGKNCEIAPTSTWTFDTTQEFAPNAFTVLPPLSIVQPGTLQWLRIGLSVEHPDTRQLWVYLQPPGVTWSGPLGAFDYTEAYENRDDPETPVLLFAERGSVNPPSRNLGNSTSGQLLYITFNLLDLFSARDMPKFFKSDISGSYFPPNKNQTNKLATLQGINMTGDWTLIMGDSSTGGDGLTRSVRAWTLETLVCGDGKVTLVDDCDGGFQCNSLCKCEAGYQRSNPISVDCTLTVIDPAAPTAPTPALPGPAAPPAASPSDPPAAPPTLLNNSAILPPTPIGGVEPTVIIVATIVPVVGVAIGAVLFIYFWRYNRRKKNAEAERLEDGSSSTPGSVAMSQVKTPPSPIYTSITSKGAHASRITARGGDTINKAGHLKLDVPYSALVFLQEIGAGGFSRVYIGEWQRTTVALKVSTSSTSEFYREATLMVNMRPHPNVVQILGLSTDGPFPALILEFCSGGSLDKLLKDSSKEITDSYRLRIISGISKGMYHLHKANIVHRDLAARNILLSGDGEPKVSDFGLSRPLAETLVGTTKSNIGPIRWMAPESLSTMEYSKASDIWSFGIVVWEIITRKEPHTDIDPIDVGVRIRDDNLVPPIPEDCDPVWRELMLKCWQTDPSSRPSFDDICEIIERHRRTLEMRELASRG